MILSHTMSKLYIGIFSFSLKLNVLEYMDVITSSKQVLPANALEAVSSVVYLQATNYQPCVQLPLVLR
jgi:hypothetical protein